MRLRARGGQDDVPSRRTGNGSAFSRPTSEDLMSRYAFRRNRTLTGSSSAQISSSNELNAELKSPRSHVHHLSNVRRRLLSYFAVVSLAALGLYILVSQLVATTVPVVKGLGPVPTADAAAYSAAVESYYAARPIERLNFVLNERALLSHIQSQRPEVRAIAIEPGSSLGEASLVITPRQAIARWAIDGANQYVDGDGVVFSRHYFDDPSLQIVDDSGIPAVSSQLVTSNRFLGFIGRVVAKSSQNGLKVAEVTIPALTTRQVAITLEGEDIQYKLSVDRSAGNQVEDVSRIHRYLATNQITPEYVDVRIAGKAFYR